MSECPYCQNTFEMTETCADEFTMWQGLVGPYYFPYIDENGVLTWSNTGDLPNPDPVNIVGPPGAGLEFSGSAETVGDLPASANEYDIYIVGTSAPFYGYIYENGGWTNIGQVGRGEQGVSIVSVTKASGTGAPGTTDTYDGVDDCIGMKITTAPTRLVCHYNYNKLIISAHELITSWEISLNTVLTRKYL